jgi:hypothetical protein
LEQRQEQSLVLLSQLRMLMTIELIQLLVSVDDDVHFQQRPGYFADDWCAIDYRPSFHHENHLLPLRLLAILDYQQTV